MLIPLGILAGTGPSYAANTLIAVSHETTPFITAYPFNAGFGTKFSNPATLPPSRGNAVAFSPTANNLGVAQSTDSITAYPFSPSGFGTRYANPVPAVGSSQGASVDLNGTDLAFGNNFSGNIWVYPFTSGFGTRYANPASLPGNTVSGIKFRPGDIAMSVAGATPSLAVYPWSTGFGFGTRYANPASAPAGTIANGIDFTSSQIAIAHNTSPRVTAYPFTTGFGTKYADPATLPSGNGLAVRIRDNDIVVGTATTPFIAAYPFTASGFGTKYADPAVVPDNGASGLSFRGNEVAVAHGLSPFVTVYPFISGFGTKYANPATAIAGTGRGVALA
jgi:hypothetical protein